VGLNACAGVFVWWLQIYAENHHFSEWNVLFKCLFIHVRILDNTGMGQQFIHYPYQRQLSSYCTV
jgi:hypothetical protein